jgi:competence protein ComEA
MGDEDIESAEVDVSVPRPAPWRSPLRRAADATTGRVRPWIAWFGAGRLAGTVLALIATVAGGWWLLRPSAPPTEATLPYASAPSTSTAAPVNPTTAVASEVVVYVAGAVATAGVYELPAGSRVVDGVAAAGGATADADLAALNLAAVLVDGERVYVPRVGEPVPVVAAPDGGAAPSVPAGPVDLNRATEAELDALPGIGPATARAIVEHRETHGPFASVDDLDDVRGIGPAKLEALRDQVTT